MYVEISREKNEKSDKRTALKELTDGLRGSGIIGKNDRFKVVNMLKIPCAYVIYDKNRNASLRVIMDFLGGTGYIQ